MDPTVVILAAGLSTRYGRLKQLEPLGPGGEPLLDYSVFDAWNSGFTRVVLIIREELEDAFRDHIRGRWPPGLEVVFHHQRKEDLPGAMSLGPPSHLEAILEKRTKPWGTAHALLTARDLLPGPFVVVNADDFYGSGSFALAPGLVGDGAEADPGQPPTFGLVSYRLRDTLSPHGGVSRGFCEVDPRGWLSKVTELTGLTRKGSFITGTTGDGQELILTGDEPVSTNFWVFTPDVFLHLEAGLQGFLGGVGTGPSSSQPEFLIPSEVNRLLETGRVRVRVRRARDPFLGITHPEDREWVVEGLAALAREKRYPDPLW